MRLCPADPGNPRRYIEGESPRLWERDIQSENVTEITDMHDETVRMTRHVERPFDGNTLSIAHTFTSLSWDRPKVSRSTLRFLGADALRCFLTEAGFTIEEQFGNWDRQPLSEKSPEIITFARLS
jgi:hypothetical protein